MYFQISLGVLVGIGCGGTAISIPMSIVGKHFPLSNRTIAMSLVTATGSFGYFISPLLTNYSLENNGWEVTLFYFIIFLSIGMFIAFFVRSPSITTINERDNDQDTWGALKEAFNNKSYLLLKNPKDALTHGYWIYYNIGDINPLLFIISQQQIMGHTPDSIIKSISNIAESRDNKYSKMFLSGVVYNQSGDQRKAEYFLRKALLEKPNDSQATIILAQILNRTGDKKKALTLLSDAVAGKSNDVNLMRR